MFILMILIIYYSKIESFSVSEYHKVSKNVVYNIIPTFNNEFLSSTIPKNKIDN